MDVFEELTLLCEQIKSRQAASPRKPAKKSVKSPGAGSKASSTFVYQIFDKTTREVVFVEGRARAIAEVNSRLEQGHQLVSFQDEALQYARCVLSNRKDGHKYFRWRKSQEWQAVTLLETSQVVAIKDRYGGIEFQLVRKEDDGIQGTSSLIDQIAGEIKLDGKFPTPVIRAAEDWEPFFRFLERISACTMAEETKRNMVIDYFRGRFPSQVTELEPDYSI